MLTWSLLTSIWLQMLVFVHHILMFLVPQYTQNNFLMSYIKSNVWLSWKAYVKQLFENNCCLSAHLTKTLMAYSWWLSPFALFQPWALSCVLWPWDYDDEPCVQGEIPKGLYYWHTVPKETKGSAKKKGMNKRTTMQEPQFKSLLSKLV